MQVSFERIGPSKPWIAVDHAGSGSLVVFLHGIGGNRTNWSEQLQVFARYFHAVAWDMRGYGDSDDYDGPLGFEDVCSDLLRLLDHFNKTDASLVGLSMGGMIAQEFYRRFPDRVRSLVLADTAASIAGDFKQEQREEFIRLRKEPLIEGKTPADIAPALVNELAGSAASEGVRDKLFASIAALRSESYLKAIEAIVGFDARDILSHITVPTLLICGTEDRVTTLDMMRVMEKKISGSKLITLEETGHLSNIEKPDEFNKAVITFLNELK